MLCCWTYSIPCHMGHPDVSCSFLQKVHLANRHHCSQLQKKNIALNHEESLHPKWLTFRGYKAQGLISCSEGGCKQTWKYSVRVRKKKREVGLFAPQQDTHCSSLYHPTDSQWEPMQRFGAPANCEGEPSQVMNMARAKTGLEQSLKAQSWWGVELSVDLRQPLFLRHQEILWSGLADCLLCVLPQGCKERDVAFFVGCVE